MKHEELNNMVETPKYRRVRQSRGSVMVLVMVALVLMAMIGTSYLQVARVQRAQAGRSTGDIDTVVEAVLVDIVQTISDDARDNAGNFLATALTNQTQGDEPFDYPYTNPDTTGGSANESQVIKLTTAASFNVYGGQLDDNWLASSFPINLGTATATWPTITNLTGIFLSASGHSDLTTLGAGGAPTEDAMTFADAQHRNFNLDLPSTADFTDTTATLLVDADKDGVPDSRWAWATIPVIESKAYVMAVRIVDLTGRINFNIATSPSDTAGLYDNETANPGSPNAPRWETPADLDFGKFVRIITNLEGSGALATRHGRMDANVIGPRVTGSAQPTLRDDRIDFWLDDATSYSPTNYLSDYTTSVATNPYSINDMFELLNQNGANENVTNNEPFETTTEGMRDFFHGGQTQADYQRYISDNANDDTDLEEFFTTEPRKLSTLLSGISQLASSGSAAEQRTRVNITPLFDTGNPNFATTQSNVYNRIGNVMSGGAIPLGLPVAQFAEQFTINITDYVDDDNFVTDPATGSNQYGFEALPMISEVAVALDYTNTGYDGTTTTSTWENNPSGTANDAAYAIEIANPFPYPIRISDVYPNMEWGPTSTGTSPLAIFGGAGDDLLAVVTAAAMQTFNAVNGITDNATTTNVDESILLYPENSIVLVFDPSATGAFSAVVSTATTLVVDASAHVNTPRTWPVDAASPDAPDVVWIGMSASTAAGTPLKESYQRFSLAATPDTFENTSDATDPGGAVTTCYQSRRSAASGINLLAIDDNHAATDILFPSSAGTTDPTQLAAATKTGFVSYTDMNDASAQVIVADYFDDPADRLAGRLKHVGELAQITALGFTTTETIAERWAASHGGTPDGQDVFLDTASAAVVDGSQDSLNVPHAVMLLDQFTMYDSEFVPGVINLNTANAELIAAALPIADDTLAGQIAAAIIDYRDNPGGRPATNVRTSPGIAYVAELLEPLRDVFAPASGTYNGDTPTYDASASAGNVRIDDGSDYFLDSVTGAPLDDGVADDQEEGIMVYRWLSQVATTRSDCFAAYIWVREHDAADFSSVTDERRLMGIFVRDAAGNASLVGRLQTDP